MLVVLALVKVIEWLPSSSQFFVCFIQGKKVTLIDEDAYVVGLAYFPPDYVRILNPAAVVAAAKGEGISLSKQRNSRTTFGLELVKVEKVKLDKAVGIRRDDVTFL